MAITTRSGKVVSKQNHASTKDEQIKEQVGINQDEIALVDDFEDFQQWVYPTSRQEKEIKEKLLLQQIPRPPTFFPQRH